MKLPRNWFRVSNVADDPTVAEIFVIDIIGDWIDELINEFYGMKATLTAKAFIEQLSKLDASVKTIRVRINSPGGDVFAALNIANELRAQQTSKGRTVETVIDGLAASAASIIAMAGSKVVMADNALMMVHQPWSVEVGNATNFRAAAETLDTISKTIVATYQWHSKLDADALMALLVGKDGIDGTWLTADEAIANGLATDKQEGLAAAASIDGRAFGALKVPEPYRDRVKAFFKPKETPAPKPVAAAAADVLAECEAGGCLDVARSLIAANATIDQVRAKVAETKQARAASAQRETDIRALCTTAKLPELAAGYVAGGMTLDQVRGHLTTITAKFDVAAIDNGLAPDVRRPKQLSAADIYASRRPN